MRDPNLKYEVGKMYHSSGAMGVDKHHKWDMNFKVTRIDSYGIFYDFINGERYSYIKAFSLHSPIDKNTVPYQEYLIKKEVKEWLDNEP